MINERQTLTSRQFAEAMGVSESSVKRWVDEGEIVAHRTAGGHRRIPMAAAVRFIRLQRARPAKPHLLSLPTMPVFGDIDADAADGLHQALLRDDAPQARAIISGRFLAGAEIAAIGDGLIRPALQRIGELWQSDPEGILLEHRAVESCLQILSEIMLWLPTPAPDAPAAIAAAGPGDPYMLPPMLAFLALRERGLRAVNLGPLTPLATVTQAVNRYGTRVCSLSMSNPYSASRGSEWPAMLDAADAAGCRVVVGGRCCESLPASIRARLHMAGSMSELGAYVTGLVQGAATPAKPGSRGRPGKRT